MLHERGFLMAQRRLTVVCILLVSYTAALAQSPQSQPATTPTTTQSPITQAPGLQERHPRYRVMPSDVLAISFPLSPELNQSVTIQPDGFITLVNVGPVYIQGQTTPEIVDTLAKAYAKILHNPIIDVDLKNFQTPQFTMFGQV